MCEKSMIRKTSSKAILYHYFEANQTYRDNLIFFLARGLTADIDVWLVLSGPCSVELPRHPNLHIIEAPNLNHDYGGYCHAVSEHGALLATYDRLAFVNSSVRGPFLPAYIEKSWYDIFSDALVGETHLIGASYNSLPHDTEFGYHYANMTGRQGPFPHIQTTAYMMTGEAFSALKASGFYDQLEAMTKSDVVAEYEIGMSEFMRSKGWRITSILSDTVFDQPDKAPQFDNFSVKEGDPQYPNAYFGRTLGAEEVVFIKTNRALLSDATLASLTFSHLSRMPQTPSDMWSEARDLFERSYLIAKTNHEQRIADYSSIRGKIRRKLDRLLAGKPKS